MCMHVYCVTLAFSVSPSLDPTPVVPSLGGLRAANSCWLVKLTSMAVIDKVVLEQFIVLLPKKAAQWVQCHRLTSQVLAIQLAEDQMLACLGVGEPLPSISLSPPNPVVSPCFSLSKPVPLPRSRTNLPSRAPPCWRRGQPQELHAGPSALPRGAGPTSPDTISAPVSPLSPRQFLDPLPATRVVGRPGPACWHSGDMGNFVERCAGGGS